MTDAGRSTLAAVVVGARRRRATSRRSPRSASRSGAIVVISSLRFLSYGWIDELYSKPGFHLRYWGFGWVPLPSPAVTTALFVATGVLGLLVALGLFYRPAMALLFVAFTYLQLVDVATYLNHYYLVSLFAALLVFIPAHRAASLDARLRPAIRAATLPAWCTYLLRFQVAVVYVNAGLAKATADWLLHAQPLNIWLSARTEPPVVGPYLDLPGSRYVAAWAGFLFDTTIVLFLLWRRTRAVRVPGGARRSTRRRTSCSRPSACSPSSWSSPRLVFFDASWPRRWLRGRAAAGHAWPRRRRRDCGRAPVARRGRRGGRLRARADPGCRCGRTSTAATCSGTSRGCGSRGG